MSTTTAPASGKVRQRPGDRWFSGTALAAGVMILVTLAAVALFLIIQSIPGLTATSETASIHPPTRTMCPVSPVTTPRSMMSAFSVGR